MTQAPADPPRLLLDASTDETTRALLAAWPPAGPSVASRERLLRALGVADAAPVVASSAKLLGVKSTGAILAAVLALGGAGYFARRAQGPAVAPPVAQALPVGVAAIPASSETPVVATVDRPAPAPSPLPAPASASPPRAVAAPSLAPETDVDSLAPQIAEIDRAKAALTQGDPSAALARARAYERRYPAGAFLEEAAVLRIEARVAAGDRHGAEADARAFLERFPKSPHEARVRALIAP